MRLAEFVDDVEKGVEVEFLLWINVTPYVIPYNFNVCVYSIWIKHHKVSAETYLNSTNFLGLL